MNFTTLTHEAVHIFARNFVVEGDSPKNVNDGRLLDIVHSFLGGGFTAIPSAAFDPIKLENAFYVLNFYALEENCSEDSAPEIYESKAYFMPGNLVYVAFENGEVITVIKK